MKVPLLPNRVGKRRGPRVTLLHSPQVLSMYLSSVPSKCCVRLFLKRNLIKQIESLKQTYFQSYPLIGWKYLSRGITDLGPRAVVPNHCSGDHNCSLANTKYSPKKTKSSLKDGLVFKIRELFVLFFKCSLNYCTNVSSDQFISH